MANTASATELCMLAHRCSSAIFLASAKSQRNMIPGLPRAHNQVRRQCSRLAATADVHGRVLAVWTVLPVAPAEPAGLPLRPTIALPSSPSLTIKSAALGLQKF